MNKKMRLMMRKKRMTMVMRMQTRTSRRTQSIMIPSE